jgi:D-psicose/D-tagatose/L-ribulose 3-epimerase
VAAAVGAHLVGGPVYAATGRTWHLESGERRSVVRRLVDRLRPVSEYAGERGIRIALEPLNRFETSVVNTAEQAMEIVERLDHRSCGVLLDTFHMNIEERDPPAAIRSCAGRLLHFHASGCDRGAPGSDHIGWAGLSRALADVGYRGMLCIESFTVQNRAIARAASIWRPLALSPDALAGEGLRFLRALG